MDLAYSAIGRAVFAAQAFESVLNPIFEFFKMHTESGYIEKTGGYVSAGAFKIPISKIVRHLSERGTIAPDLEVRLTNYSEARNTLIHRWIQEHGWPSEGDPVGFRPIIELANMVECEAKSLTQLFVDYILQHASSVSKTPDETELKTRVAELFQRVHLDQ